MDASNVNPVGLQLLVKQLARERTKGGIFLPSTQTELKIARVLKVGDGLPPRRQDGVEIKPTAKAGQVVIYYHPAAKDVPGTNPEDKLLLINDEEVVARIDGVYDDDAEIKRDAGS